MVSVNQVADWGLRPILFQVGEIKVESYTVMVILALFVGIIVYRFEIKNKSKSNELLWLLIAAVIGGTIGAKIPVIVSHFKEIISGKDISALFTGRTVISGIIGGIIAVVLTRKYLGIKEKMGNAFVPAIAISILIGRIGCLMAGCCFGRPTNLPWGINFGDGIFRHPTQIYEIIFFLTWFFVSLYLNQRDKIKNGVLFETFMVTYFLFRFLVEYIREEPIFYLGLTLAQVVSLLVVAYYSIAYLIWRSHGSRTK